MTMSADSLGGSSPAGGHPSARSAAGSAGCGIPPVLAFIPCSTPSFPRTAMEFSAG